MPVPSQLYCLHDVVERVHARSEEWIILNPLDEPRPDRIFDNVPGNAQRRVVAAQSSFVSVPLPQSLTEHFLEVEGRELLRSCDESSAIRISCFCFHQQMHMVWHEAVRKNCKSFVNRCAQELPMHGVGTFAVHEDASTFERAKREEISMRAEIIERPETFRLAGDHIARWASRMPPPSRGDEVRLKRDTTHDFFRVRLKPDTTYAGSSSSSDPRSS
jgi:hypothetical protein